MGIEDWSAEERNEVLQFYGLDTLTPTEWIDNNNNNNTNNTDIQNDGKKMSSTAMTGQVSNDEILSSLASLDNARQLLREEYDPLELKDPQIVRQILQARAITAPLEHSVSNVDVISNLNSSADNMQSSIAAVTSNSILTTKNNFDSKTFLKEMHGDTLYADLLEGKDNLKTSCQQRKEVLKYLVKQNFDRFVNAKNSTEAVFKDMKEKNLNSSDHGMRRAMEAVGVAYIKSQEVFSTLLARRERESLLRRRLEMFSRYSFIFSLGYRLEQSLKMGEYGAAVSDYRKAKEMRVEGSMISKTLKVILERIWSGHIEKTLTDLRSDLFIKLKNPLFYFDSVHSKILLNLLALDTQPDPVMEYYNFRRQYLWDTLTDIVTRTKDEVDSLKPDADKNSSMMILFDSFSVLLKKSSSSRNLQVASFQYWRIISTAVASISEFFITFYKDFDKFLTSSLFTRDPIEFVNEAKLKFVNIFKAILDPPPTNNINSGVAALVFGKRILPLFTKINNTGINLAMDSILSTTIWNAIQEDCKVLPSLETYSWSGEGFDLSTTIIKHFENLIVATLEAFPDSGQLSLTFKMFVDALKSAAINLQAVTADRVVSDIDSHSLSSSYKTLILLANLLYIRKVALPRILSIQPLVKNLVEILDDGEEEVKQIFLTPHHTKLVAIVRSTLLTSTDYSTQRWPHDMPSTPHTILLTLIAVQTQINDVSTAILASLMGHLVKDLFQEYLHCFQIIRHFGEGGYVLARLHVTYLQSKLITIMDQEAMDIYSTILDTLDSSVSDTQVQQKVKSHIDQIIRDNDSFNCLTFSCFQYS